MPGEHHDPAHDDLNPVAFALGLLVVVGLLCFLALPIVSALDHGAVDVDADTPQLHQETP